MGSVMHSELKQPARVMLFPLVGICYNISLLIKEMASNSAYILSGETKEVTTSSSATSTVIFYNQVVRGDIKFKKIDTTSGEVMKNIPFRITSLSNGESHIVVTNNDGIVNTSSSFALHSNNYKK